MTTIKYGTWVLVADGEKALFFENQTDGADPHLKVVRKEEQDNLKEIDQSTNRPIGIGRSAGHGSDSYDDTDWHELAKDRFAADLADLMYTRVHKGKFDNIVLVATPNVLGELRNQLHQVVTDKVVGEIPKTLTNHPLTDIEKIVKTDLAA